LALSLRHFFIVTSEKGRNIRQWRKKMGIRFRDRKRGGKKGKGIDKKRERKKKKVGEIRKRENTQ
jgi:hypothetical protein